MVDFKNVKNVSDELQNIIRGAKERIEDAIKKSVTITGIKGSATKPKNILGTVRSHGLLHARLGVRSFDGMGAAHKLLDTLSKKDKILNQDIRLLFDALEILKAVDESKEEKGEGAINPRNIKFTVVKEFKLDKKSKPHPNKPTIVERHEVFGHFLTPTVLKYIEAKKKWHKDNSIPYTGASYDLTEAQVRGWALPVANRSRPPLYKALEIFIRELLSIINELEDEPPEPPIEELPTLFINRAVDLKELGKVESLKEGFVEILSDDSIYPRIAVRRDGKKVRGSNKPVWQSDSRPSFTSKVEQYVFSIKGDADREALDAAVPGWGQEPDDLAITQYYDRFKIQLTSINRTKRLARECFGGAQIARQINVPGRTPGVMLKSDEPRIKTFGVNIRGRGRNKMLILNQTFAHINNRPATAKELLEIMSSGVIKRTEGQPKKNPFSSTNSLAQFLRRHGYSVEGMERTGMYGSPTTLWGPRME